MVRRTRRWRDQETTYYACITNLQHHRDQPWYPQHPKAVTVREDHLLPVIGRFFGERILGPDRGLYLNFRQPQVDEDHGVGTRQATLRVRLNQLTRAQSNLIKQLESYEPTGDEAIDTEWRSALQRRFVQITTEHRATSQQLAAMDTQDRPGGNPALLDLLPLTAIDPTVLPETDQRELYDAFHLQARYDRVTHQITLQVTIYAEAVPTLTRTVHTLTNSEPHKINNQECAGAAAPALSLFERAPGGSRTHTGGGLSSVPLPIGLRGHLAHQEYPLR
jgi:site-specific DNA recombinase